MACASQGGTTVREKNLDYDEGKSHIIDTICTKQFVAGLVTNVMEKIGERFQIDRKKHLKSIVASK